MLNFEKSFDQNKIIQDSNSYNRPKTNSNKFTKFAISSRRDVIREFHGENIIEHEAENTQSKGGPSRVKGEIVATLMRRHCDSLQL